MRPPAFRAGGEFQHALRDGHADIGRNHIDAVALDPEIIGDLAHRHGSHSFQKVRQGALMLRIEVLHQDKAHACIGGQIFEQLGECIQPPG